MQTMRKREYQSFTLKLNDLKEYDAAQKERAENKAAKLAETMTAKYGQKSVNEIRERIGYKSKPRSSDGL